MLLVQVVSPGGKVLFRGQHLSAGNAVFAEQFVVVVDQLDLPDCGKELSGRYGVQATVAFHLAAARGHGTRRNDDDFDSVAVELCELVRQGGHAGGVESAVGTRQYITPDLYDHSLEFVSVHETTP